MEATRETNIGQMIDNERTSNDDAMHGHLNDEGKQLEVAQQTATAVAANITSQA